MRGQETLQVANGDAANVVAGNVPLISRELSRAAKLAGPTAIAVAIATTVALSAQYEGAYYVDVWGPLGLVLVVAAVTLAVLRRAPSLLASVSAGAVLLLGGWAVLSTQWGGIPNAAWILLDQSMIAAAALFVGSALVTNSRFRIAVYTGVFLGLTGHAAGILIRVAADGGPRTWYFQRYLEGPVGYHNAQATLLLLGLPLALGAATARRVPVRAVGGASIAALLGALILTQSRGGLLAAGVAAGVLLLWARDLRLALFATPVAGVTAGLLLAIRRVDAALVDGRPALHVDELRRYVVWTALAAVVLGGLAVANSRTRAGLIVGIVAATVTLAVGVAGGVDRRGTIETVIDRVTSSASDNSPDTAPAGATRLASLSLNGRRDAWRVAWAMTRDHPLRGAGVGQFSRRWVQDRKDGSLYIVQPHSLELEYLSELGGVGLLMFAVFLAAALGCAARARAPRLGAVALAMVAGLVVESSVDWTWSFPAAVVPVFLVVGASGGGVRRNRLVLAASIVPLCILAAIALALPYLSDRQLDRGRSLAVKSPDRAWSLIQDAQVLNRWDDRVFAAEGAIAKRSRLYRLAAQKYERSAQLSRQPWIAYFQEATVLRQAHAAAAARQACRRAISANPTEPLLHGGPCAAGAGT